MHPEYKNDELLQMVQPLELFPFRLVDEHPIDGDLLCVLHLFQEKLTTTNRITLYLYRVPFFIDIGSYNFDLSCFIIYP